jgi:putative Ig domain-containing protein
VDHPTGNTDNPLEALQALAHRYSQLLTSDSASLKKCLINFPGGLCMRTVRSAILLYFAVLLFFQLGCAGTTAGPAADASIGATQLVSLSPTSVTAGHAGFLLTVKGANFSHQSVIFWNGAEQTTAFINSEEMTALIPAQSVSQATTISVAIKSVQSGQMSNALTLTISDPPKITTTTLPVGQAGASYSAPLTVSGGVAPYHWSTSSTLPTGLAMNSQTGTISGNAVDAGDSALNVMVTDSLSSSANANLVINIAPATQTTSPVSTPSSQYYGSGIGSDGLANTTVGPSGNMVSYRFRAKHSGAVQEALIYLIPDHPGYAAGNAGTTLVTLNTDDATPSHNPTSTVLASYVMTNVLSLPSPGRYFYTLKFASPPTLTAGQLYHMVFKNVADSPTVNFLSVDALYQLNFSAPLQGAISDTDAAVLLSEEGGAWKPRAGYTPIYQLEFPNGVTEGIGYIEGWVSAPRPISGTNAVREVFTVSGSDTNVNSVAIRVARVTGNNPLVIRLENANGSLIEEGSIPATSIPLSSPTSPSYYWTNYKFSSTYTLAPGDTYHLDIQASSTSTYEAFPIRKGLAYGFQNTTYFPDGHAEFEQNGSWTGWIQWGVANRTDGDLQFYFSIAP